MYRRRYHRVAGLTQYPVCLVGEPGGCSGSSDERGKGCWSDELECNVAATGAERMYRPPGHYDPHDLGAVAREGIGELSGGWTTVSGDGAKIVWVVMAWRAVHASWDFRGHRPTTLLVGRA
jgi:hypothetical protein